MPYDGKSPPENVMSEAVEHEKTCLLNPYLETIAKLYDGIRDLERNKDLYSKHFAEKRLFRLLPENAKLSGDAGANTNETK